MNEIKTKESLIIKDIKELGNLTRIEKNIESNIDKNIKNENINYLNLIVNEKKDLKFIETKESIHLTLELKKNTSMDLGIIFTEKNKELIINAKLNENSFARINCFSNNEITTKYDAECESNSRFEAINFSLSKINSNTEVNLKDDSSCLIVNSYYNYEDITINNDDDKNNDNNNNKDDKKNTKNKEKKTGSIIKDKVIHSGKNTKSLISSKGYLINSKIDSRGLIRIEPSAFDAQGFQESQILLEGNSKVISIPDLEILNNEVKCSHGSTISRIKDEELFYFESRGITKEEARKLLIKGHLLSIIPEQINEYAEKFFEEGKI